MKSSRKVNPTCFYSPPFALTVYFPCHCVQQGWHICVLIHSIQSWHGCGGINDIHLPCINTFQQQCLSSRPFYPSVHITKWRKIWFLMCLTCICENFQHNHILEHSPETLPILGTHAGQDLDELHSKSN